jgi:hypothetical protein
MVDNPKEYQKLKGKIPSFIPRGAKKRYEIQRKE